MKTDPSEELVEVVRPDGSVFHVTTRSEMRKSRLNHRSVYVAVLGGPVSNPAIVVHRRADFKDINPGTWDLAFGGVCDVGEDWLEAAERELAEEAGIVNQPLTFLGQQNYSDAQLAVVGQLFVVRYDGPIQFCDGEVQQIEYVPVSQLDAWIDRHAVCRDSAALVAPKVVEFVDSAGRDEI